MKNLLILLLTSLYATCTFASTPLQFENIKAIKNDNTASKVQFIVNYPQIKNPNLISEKHFNKLAKDSALALMSNFQKDLASSNTDSLPAEIKSSGSSLTITYQLHALEPKSLISLRFLTNSNAVGSAHPSHTYSAINYDLKLNKPVTLQGLLKSQGLEHIAKLTSHKIMDKLHKAGDSQAVTFKEGFNPTVKNFRVWNLTPDGLLITFNEYQVLPYVYGPQEVTIAYQDLKGSLNNNELTSCLAQDQCRFSTFNSGK